MNVFLCTSQFCSAVGEEGEKDVFNRIIVKVVFALFLFLPKKEVFLVCPQSQGVWVYLINLK